MKRIFQYSDGERHAINAAYDAAVDLARSTHAGLERELDAALALERPGRAGALMARAMILEGFVEGFGRNPRASELARYTPAVRAAAVIGAQVKSLARAAGRRIDGGDCYRTLRLCRDACAAHAKMLDRGLRKSARAVVNQPPEEVLDADVSPA